MDRTSRSNKKAGIMPAVLLQSSFSESFSEITLVRIAVTECPGREAPPGRRIVEGYFFFAFLAFFAFFAFFAFLAIVSSQGLMD
jgi:hypothetical protein